MFNDDHPLRSAIVNTIDYSKQTINKLSNSMNKNDCMGNVVSNEINGNELNIKETTMKKRKSLL